MPCLCKNVASRVKFCDPFSKVWLHDYNSLTSVGILLFLAEPYGFSVDFLSNACNRQKISQNPPFQKHHKNYTFDHREKDVF